MKPTVKRRGTGLTATKRDFMVSCSQKDMIALYGASEGIVLNVEGHGG